MKQSTITVNSVINWSFFYYICCFSIFSSNFIDSKSGVTICNPSPKRRLDTWRHGARDHSTSHRPLGLPTYKRYIVIKSLSPAIFETIGTKYIGVTILTIQGHVTSSVTWPFDSQVAIFYRRSIDTKSISSHYRDNGHRTSRGHDLDLLGSRDVNGHVINWFPGCHVL